MGQEIDRSQNSDNKQHGSYLDGAIDAVWRRDPNATGPQGQDYLKELIKTVPLFMGGRVALAGAAALNAFDQAKPEDSAGTQLLDGALGATKGAAMKLMFDKIGGANVNFVAKGVGMGLTARTLEVGLNRNSYLENGEFSFTHGLKETGWSMISPKQLGADMVIGSLGYGALRNMGHLPESRLMGTVMTGTVFGASSGAFHELNRQTAQGKFDFLALGKETLIHGGIGGLGAAPGGFQAALKYRPENFGPIPPELSRANRERLYDPVDTTALARVAKQPGAKYSSMGDFYMNGLHDVNVPVREYSISGHSTKLQIPTAFDNALPGIRANRELAAQPMFGEKFNLAQTLRVAGARLQLDASPLRGRYLPEDLVTGLDMTPNSALIKQLMAAENAPTTDVRIKQHGGEPAIAEKFNGDRLVFYRPPENWHPDNTFVHEWSHIQHDGNKPAFAAFHAALKLEQYGYDYRGYAKYNVNENWAVNSEPLLGASQKEFQTLVDRAPVRAAVMGKALTEALSAVPAEQWTAHQKLLADRAKYIEEQVVPRAKQDLARANGADARVADIVREYLDGKMNTTRADEVLGMKWEYDYYRE